MDNQTAITLKPKLGYWVSKYFVIIVVASLLPFSAIYWDLEMPVHYALMVLFLVVWIMLCYTYKDTRIFSYLLEIRNLQEINF